jgi:hypothetical protein
MLSGASLALSGRRRADGSRVDPTPQQSGSRPSVLGRKAQRVLMKLKLAGSQP